MDALHSGRNIPTVLQSLGCIAQNSISVYETREGEIMQFMYEKIFQTVEVGSLIFLPVCFSVAKRSG